MQPEGGIAVMAEHPKSGGDSRLPATTDRILALSGYSTAVVIDSPIDVIDHKEFQVRLATTRASIGASALMVDHTSS